VEALEMASVITNSRDLLLSRLGQTSRIMAQVIEHRLAPTGISYQEMRITGLLMGEDNITQKDLAEKLSVRAATLSVAVSKLEKQGLVKRVASKTDKRVNFLQLLPSKKIPQVDTLLTAIDEDMTHGISSKELEITSKVLTLMLHNLKNTLNQQASL